MSKTTEMDRITGELMTLYADAAAVTCNLPRPLPASRVKGKRVQIHISVSVLPLSADLDYIVNGKNNKRYEKK